MSLISLTHEQVTLYKFKKQNTLVAMKIMYRIIYKIILSNLKRTIKQKYCLFYIFHICKTVIIFGIYVIDFTIAPYIFYVLCTFVYKIYNSYHIYYITAFVSGSCFFNTHYSTHNYRFDSIIL